jgi:DNA ligase-4
MIRVATPNEQKWIVRLILKHIKMSVSQETIMKLFHEDAVELFNVCSSLKKICVQLLDPNVRHSFHAVQLLEPFKPMLAKMEDSSRIVPILGTPFAIETKLDGERIQLHKNGEVYKYYSRNGIDYTTAYGASKYEGSLTKHIHKLFNCDKLILDGEMLVYDPISGDFPPFGLLKTISNGKYRIRM